MARDTSPTLLAASRDGWFEPTELLADEHVSQWGGGEGVGVKASANGSVRESSTGDAAVVRSTDWHLARGNRAPVELVAQQAGGGERSAAEEARLRNGLESKKGVDESGREVAVTVAGRKTQLDEPLPLLGERARPRAAVDGAANEAAAVDAAGKKGGAVLVGGVGEAETQERSAETSARTRRLCVCSRSRSSWSDPSRACSAVACSTSRL